MKLPARLFALVALFGALLPLPAFAAGKCGLTTVSGGTTTTTYDPFNPTSATINLTGVVLSRVNGAGGEKTSSLNFYVKGQSPVQDGTQMVITSAVGSGTSTGTGQNVFFNFNGPFPSPLDNSSTPPPGILHWEFTGNNPASDLFTVNMTITLPPNLNLTASTALLFDIVYSCAGTGGGSPFTDTGTRTGAITANVTVQSALRASFAGGLVGGTPAMAFGEIGNVTNATAATKFTPTNNYVRVQATAPYKVNLTSARNFNMTVGGNATADPLQKIGYNLKFLGVIKAANDSSGIVNKQCNRPGVGDNVEDKLYIQAQLAEGGAGKAPSANYFDTLTVTIEPLAIGTSDPGFVCGGATNGQF